MGFLKNIKKFGKTVSRVASPLVKLATPVLTVTSTMVPGLGTVMALGNAVSDAKPRSTASAPASAPVVPTVKTVSGKKAGWVDAYAIDTDKLKGR